jgi:putative DNA-invertase from lambdoid prophage Rac
MAPRPLRVARYLRVSTKDQSLDLQRDETAAYAAQRGWVIVATYEDTMSGASTKRPGLAQAMKDARRGRYDVLLAWKSDRLFRSLSDFVRTVTELGEMSVAFASVTEPIDSSTAAGRLVANIMAVLAEFERSLIRERCVAGLAAARRRGVRVGRPPARFDLEEARDLREAGASYKAIAAKLGVSVGVVHKGLTAVQKPPPGAPSVAADFVASATAA